MKDNEKNELVKQDSQISNLIQNVDEVSSLTQLKTIAQEIVDSKIVPVNANTTEKVLNIILTGRELGFGPMTSLRNIHVIDGRASLGIHAITTRLQECGYYWKVIKDFEKIIRPEFDESKPEDDVNVKVAYVPIVNASNQITNQIPNCETIIEFYCPIPETLSTFLGEKYLVHRIRYTIGEAYSAGLLKPNSAWDKYPKVQLWNRTFMFGARRYAPSALSGILETTEAKDIAKGSNLNVDPSTSIITSK